MSTDTPQQQPKVAVLLATYNGAQFVAAQIKSLAENTTSFTLSVREVSSAQRDSTAACVHA